MDKIFDKISSYNIFNYIVPGAVFMYLLSMIVKINAGLDNVFYNLCFSYFVGLLLSRVGSLIIEPIYKKVGFVKYVEYVEYSKAYKKSNSIDLMNEINNMYRTFSSVFLVLLLIVPLSKLFFGHGINWSWLFFLDGFFWSFLFVFILMSFSYRKQTSYIKNKVEFLNSEGD